MRKKYKRCDHCIAKFKNRENLRNHLVSFHGAIPYRCGEAKPVTEGKPHRRIRMMMNAARHKKERDDASSFFHKPPGPAKIATFDRRARKNIRTQRMAS